MNDWSIAEQHAERAWRHYEAGRWDHALRLLRRALTIQPDQADWWFGVGLTLDALMRYEQAVDAYKSVLEIQPQDHEALLHLGIDLVRIGQAQEAIDCLNQAQEIEPDNHTCRCHRIAAHTQLGDHDQAELEFYLAQQDDPNCPVCFDHIAHALAIRGELPRAIWCWQRTLELDPNHTQARANMARAYWFLGKLGQARFLFERHVDEQADDAFASLEFASLLLEMDELDDAEQRLAGIITTEPENATAHHLLGDLYIKRKNAQAARACYLCARESAPQRPGVDLGLALAANLIGDADARCTHLLAELEHAGQDARQVLELARQLLDAQLSEQVIALLTPMVEGFDDLLARDEPSLAEALRLRALAMREADNHAQAIADCREAVRLNPALTDAWTQLAQGYEQAGQLPRAIVCLNHAIELAPDDAALRKLASKLRRQALTKAAFKSIRRAA